jgi:RNA polymerase sigma-70 factor, ECF subfamily
MEERLPPETPHLRAFLRKLAMGAADFDIDDLVQETMNRALRYQSSYDSARPVRQWLFSIGFRVFLDSRERAKRTGEERLSVFGTEAVADPALSTVDRVTRPDVRPLLAALEEPEREILERTYLRSESIAEVASGVSLAEGTVKSHLHRARKKLAERFEKEDWL